MDTGNPFVEIRKSPIHGLSVFARVPIPAETKIAYYTGVAIMWSEIKARYGDDYRFIYRTMPWLPQIVSKECKNIINYINDGAYGQKRSKVNCFLKSRWLIANRDIKKGEELLLEYPKNYFRHTPS